MFKIGDIVEVYGSGFEYHFSTDGSYGEVLGFDGKLVRVKFEKSSLGKMPSVPSTCIWYINPRFLRLKDVDQSSAVIRKIEYLRKKFESRNLKGSYV